MSVDRGSQHHPRRRGGYRGLPETIAAERRTLQEAHCALIGQPTVLSTKVQKSTFLHERQHLPLRVCTRPRYRRTHALRFLDLPHLRLLPGLQLPHVAHVATLQDQGGAGYRGQASASFDFPAVLHDQA